MQPDSIGIRELRQHASRYVDIVRAGQRIGVTDRGVLVAYLVPAEVAGSVLERLAAVGDYQPPAGGIADLLPVPSAPAGHRPLSEALQELRGEERW
jgi:prevent-host-death family protein